MERTTVVITGSTRGFGRSLAEEFLDRGHQVIVCSKNKDSVHQALINLKPKYHENVHLMVADVANYDDCVRVKDFAIDHCGSIDILVNNAATNAYARKNYLEFDPTDIHSIVGTNLVGMMNCCHVIMPHMMSHGKGTIINVEGAGSENNETKGYAVYGATKSAVTQFTKTLRSEYQDNNIHLCLISPGMMITELLCTDMTPELEFAVHLFGEDPSVISEWITPKILDIDSHQTIRYLTWIKIIKKTIHAFILYFRSG